MMMMMIPIDYDRCNYNIIFTINRVRFVSEHRYMPPIVTGFNLTQNMPIWFKVISGHVKGTGDISYRYDELERFGTEAQILGTTSMVTGRARQSMLGSALRTGLGCCGVFVSAVVNKNKRKRKTVDDVEYIVSLLQL